MAAAQPHSTSAAPASTAVNVNGDACRDSIEFNGVSLLGPTSAQELDADLMSDQGGYLVEQLMELAGLSCSQALATVFPLATYRSVLVVAGPGNNGGDGLVCARHLRHLGYVPGPVKCGSMLEMKTLFLVALRAADLLQIFLLLL